MIFRKNALAHQRAGHGHGQKFGEFFHLRSRVCRESAATGVEDRIAGLYEDVGGTLNILRIRRSSAPGTHRFILEAFIRRFRAQDIPRHLQDNRPRRPRAQGGESAPDDARNFIGPGKRALPFDQPIKNSTGDLLLVIFSEFAQGMLPHQQQHRYVVGITSGNARQRIRRPRSRAGHGDAHVTRGASVAVGNLDA
jgi:hypothetical protein